MAGPGIDSQPGKVYSSESIPWFLKRLQIQAQLGGGRGKAASLKSRGFLHFPRSRGRRHSQKSHWMPHMKNIYTPKKKMFKTTATFCEVEVAVGCWVLSLSTNYRDLSAIIFSAAPKKVCLFRHTSKTQGIGVGDGSRKMVVLRSLGAWSRFAHHCWLPLYEEFSCVQGFPLQFTSMSK